MTWRDKWPKWLNKYVITLLVFGVVFIFYGEQSIVRCVERSHDIRQAREKLERTRIEIQRCQRDIRTLENTDSLERVARERYFMHKPNEDIYYVQP